MECNLVLSSRGDTTTAKRSWAEIEGDAGHPGENVIEERPERRLLCEEALRSLAIYGGRPHVFTVLDVTHELTSAGALRRVRFRSEKHLARPWLWQNLVLRIGFTRARLGLRRRSTINPLSTEDQ